MRPFPARGGGAAVRALLIDGLDLGGGRTNAEWRKNVLLYEVGGPLDILDQIAVRVLDVHHSAGRHVLYFCAR